MTKQKEIQIRHEIAEKLKEARVSKHMKQSELAKKAGVHSNYYARVERGEAMPSILTLIKLLPVLELGYEDILPKLK